MKHSVILWNHVQVASAARDPHQLGNYTVGVRDRVQNVPANGEIETPVGGIQLEHALVLERQARSEI